MSASAMTGTVGSSEACIVPASTKSLRVAIAKSGMPRRDAVVAAPLLIEHLSVCVAYANEGLTNLWYRQVKPASKAQRALIPSQIPGAT